MRNTRPLPETSVPPAPAALGRARARLARLANATIVGVIAALAIPASGFAVTDDTEVFFNPYAKKPDKPNVLFIIDNSGSMDNCVPFRTISGRTATAERGDCTAAQTRLGNIKSAMFEVLKNEDLKKSINAGFMLFEGQAERAVQPIYYPVTALDAPASSIDNGPTALPAGVTLAEPEVVPSVRTRLMNIVDTMRPRDGTPIVGALLEAGRYLRGDAVGLQNAFFRKTTNPNDRDQAPFGVSHRAAVNGGTFSNCASVNSAGVCTNLVSTSCPSGLMDGQTGGNTRCNFISGAATYKSPLTADRGDQFALAQWNADGTYRTLDPPPCRNADHIILLTDGEPTLFRYSPGNPHFPDPNLEAAARTFTGTASCRTQPTIGDFIGEGNCGPEIAAYLYNPNRTGENGDLRPNAGTNGPTGSSKQWVITSTIAFALDSVAGKAYLQEISRSGRGLYQEASDNKTLQTALFKILNQAIPKTKSAFASPRFASQIGSVVNDDTIYVSLFEPSNTIRWNGNVKKYRACTDQIAAAIGTYNRVTKRCDLVSGESVDYGTILAADGAPLLDPDGTVRRDSFDIWGVAGNGTGVTQGGAGALLRNRVTTRTLYTSTGTYQADDPRRPSSAEPIFLRTSEDVSPLLPAWFGAADVDARNSIIDWIGRPTDTIETAAGPQQQPAWPFYDPMHASAIPITFAFGSGNSRTILSKVFVPDNGGGLRMIDDITGQEDWMFIPNDLLPLQSTLRANGGFALPTSTRVYGLDGSPVLWIRDFDRDGVVTTTDCPATGSEDARCDFVRLVFGQRDGGRRYFVVDITPVGNSASTATITPRLLWRINADDPLQTDFADLGRTWSKPTMGKLRLPDPADGKVKLRDVIIFGGGNDGDLNDKFGPTATPRGNAVFVVDAETGALLQKIGGSGSTAITDMVFPIPGKITAFDSNGDGETDRLYYGDIGGNLWRSDIVATSGVVETPVTFRIADLADNPPAGTPTPIQLTNADPSATPKPIDASATAGYRSFYFAPEVVRIDNTKFGGRFDMVIIASGHSGHPLDDTVHNAIFAIKDFNVRRYQDLKKDAESRTPPQTFAGPVALTPADLVDLTSNPLQRKTNGDFYSTGTDATLADLQTKNGWVIYMVDPDVSGQLNRWRGEKSYSQPVVIAGKLLYNTFIPPTIAELRSTGEVGICTVPQGRGRLYARDLLTGGAVFTWWDDSPGQTTEDKANLARNDTYREVGGVPPSELGIGVFGEGISAAMGESEGFKVGEGLPRNRIYWNER